MDFFQHAWSANTSGTYLAISNGWLLLGYELLCCLRTCLSAQVLDLGLTKDDICV